MIDGWKKKSVGDIADVVTGKTPPTSDRTNYGDHLPFVSPADLGTYKYISKSEKHLSEKGAKKARILPVGTSLFTCIGSIGKVGLTAVDLTTNQQINAAIPKNGSVNKEYLYYALCDIAPRVKRIAGVQAVPIINKTEFENQIIYLPADIPEQKAIAALLSTWDEAIEKTEQLIVKKQKFYEAQLSKRLSLDVSERIKLKKFLKEVSKRNRDLSIAQVLSVTNSKGFVRPEEQFDRQVASDNLSNYKIVSKGEYAYNPSRINVGSIARLDDWDFGVLSPMYTVFEIKKPSELHTDLFLHWLNSHEAKQRIKLSAQGSVRETVSFDDFCAIGFPKIDFNEQKALAEYFSLISAEIDTLKALSDKYKTQKHGLMQKMLTGEWRVKPEIVNQYMEA